MLHLRMPHLRTLCGVLALTTGCLWDRDVDGFVPRLDPDSPGRWGAPWRERVDEAVDRWRAAVGPCHGRGVPYVVEADAAGPDDVDVTLFTRERFPFPSGYAGYWTGYRVVVRGPDPSEELGLVVDIVMHEVGHAMGLDHSEDPASIMYPVVRGVVDPTAADVSSLRSALGCG